MTRKKAIEIVVANVKMGWPPKRWIYAGVGPYRIEFWRHPNSNYLIPVRRPPTFYGVRWEIPRKWLEEKGYL